MGLSVHDFWQLIVVSGLHDEEECRRLADGFAKARESGAIPRTTSLPEWMLAGRAMTRYQAKILLGGKPGPFLYGDYLVTEPCDSAELAGLFRAVHRPTGVGVVLRFVSGPALEDPQVVALLAAQAVAAAAISRESPYLTHCHTFVETPTFKFFVVEALPKKTLAATLTGRPWPLPEALRLAWQVTQGLTRMQRAGPTHGAVRPRHIWLSASGPAQLASFPLLQDPLSFGSVDATPPIDPDAVAYCAPECAAGEPAQAASDIFSLGCTLYQLLTGRVPFPPDAAATAASRERGAAAFPPVNQLNPAVPEAVAATVARMLATDPRERFADAGQLAAVLEPLAKQCGAKVTAAAIPHGRAKLDKWLIEQGVIAIPSPGTAAATAPMIMVTDGGAAPVSNSGVRRKRTRRSLVPLAGGVFAAVLVLAAVGVWLLISDARRAPVAISAPAPAAPHQASITPDQPAEQTEAPVEAPAVPAGETPDPAVVASPKAAAPMEPAADNVIGLDATMWASPTHGPPLDLKYLVPGAEVIVALRPADFAPRGETEKILDLRTSGALGQFVSKNLVELVATPLEDIEHAVIGLLASADGAPRVALVVTLREAPAPEALEKAWGNPQAKEHEGVKYYQQAERAFYTPAAEAGRVVVIGPADLIVEEVIPAAGNPPPLSLEMEVLLAASDADRDVTVLATPSVLYTGGREWLPGNSQRLRGPLDWFLTGHEADADPPASAGPDSTMNSEVHPVDLSSHGLPAAVLASAHLGDEDLFVELRVYAETNRPAQSQAEEYRQRVARMAKRVSEYLRSLALGDYSRDVLFDFPLMVEQLQRHITIGTDGRQVVLRAYLPAIAAHNLALGTHLALLEQPRSGGAPGTGSKQPQAAAAPTAAAEPIAKRLDQKTSLSFNRATLEQSLQTLADDLGIKIAIMGSDLQLEGITKNQSFGLQEQDQPARDILRKIMLKANPDGKLIYVIKAPAGGEGETLYVTTRAAAAKRGDTLPPEFAEQP